MGENGGALNRIPFERKVKIVSLRMLKSVNSEISFVNLNRYSFSRKCKFQILGGVWVGGQGWG